MMALMLMLLPMPDWTVWLRPVWLLLVLIYWAMVMPYQVGVGVAWVVGIIEDLLTSSMLGEHALALSFVIYLVSSLHIRLKVSPLLQQSLMVLLFVLLYQFIIYCIQGFIGELPSSHLYWLSPLTSMLLWPWFFILMNDYRRWIRV
jgi:rod shape-determining protein MreD